MQIKAIQWEYMGQEHCLWKGRAIGLLSHVSFFITLTGNHPEEYLIRTDTNGIANETCIGLEQAKVKAQELLNSYTIGLIFQ